MKSKAFLALFGLITFLMTSCNFTENITINPDGTGKVNLDMDGSQIMAMAGNEMGRDGEKRMDTTIYYKDMFAAKKDSIFKLPKAEQERLKKLENFSVKVLMDPDTQEFKFSLMSDFKKIEELGDLMDAFGHVNPMNKKKEEGMPDMGFEKYQTNSAYIYNGKKFSKSVSRLERAKPVEGDSIFQGMMAMFEGSTYTVNYNFPKRVKSVSDKTATLSADKKKVTVVYPFATYLEKPKDMSLEVEFEK